MAIITKKDVPLLPQPSTGVCWFMCAKMLYKWQIASGFGSMLNPETADDGAFKKRFDDNNAWLPEDNGYLADHLKMTKRSVTLDYDSVKSALDSYGPLWVAGKKHWNGGNHGHVIVVCGVADTGVLIHDPEPMHKGDRIWLTWTSIKKYVDGVDSAYHRFLTAV